MKQIIGLDLDGVILDHIKNKIAVSRGFGIILKPNETPHEIMKNKVPDETYRMIREIIYDDPKIAFSPPIVNGAISGLQHIKNKGIPFFLISLRRNPDLAIEVLKHKGLWPRFFGEDNVFFVEESRGKDTTAQQLGVTAYLDDEVGVLRELNHVRNKFLFDPLGIFPSSGFTSVGSWPEFLKNVEGLEQ